MNTSTDQRYNRLGSAAGLGEVSATIGARYVASPLAPSQCCGAHAIVVGDLVGNLARSHVRSLAGQGWTWDRGRHHHSRTMRPRWLALLLLAAPASAQENPDAVAAVPRIDRFELRNLIDRGAVLVLDVRSAEDYRKGHLPGAISVPLETVAVRAQEFRFQHLPLVTYCA
jgi:hypothetical protein